MTLTSSSTPQEAFGQLAALLLDAGYAVTDVRLLLEEATPSDWSIQVQPGTIWIDTPEQGCTRMVLSSGRSLTLEQTGAAGILATKVGKQQIATADIPVQIEKILADKPKMHWWRILLGSALLSAAITVIFSSPWWASAASALLGMVVGTVLARRSHNKQSHGVLPFFAALFVGLGIWGISILLNVHDLPLYALCGPLVMLVPGSAITNAVLEISEGDPVSGGGRLVSGLLVWGMLAAGILVAVELTRGQIGNANLQVHSPSMSIHLPKTESIPWWEHTPPLWAHWVAVLLFALGFALYYVASWQMTLAIIAVLLFSYGMLTAFHPIAGSVIAGGISAGLTLFAARGVVFFDPAWPSIVLFRPAFQMLVPGSLGLVTVLDIAANPQTEISASASLLAAVLALTIGIQIGAMMAAATLPRLTWVKNYLGGRHDGKSNTSSAGTGDRP